MVEDLVNGVEEKDESFLDLGIDLDDVPDLSTVPDEDYKLRLVTFEKRPAKKKGPFLFTEFEIADMPDTKIVRHVLMLPQDSDPIRQQKNRQRAIKYFYKAFDIPTSGPIAYADYIGNTGWVTLTEETDPTYGKQNRVARFRSAE
ncbi:MAG: hypothetical protein QMD92_00090 [bacterium]|nr:hypothetical protein [bacterium]